MVRVIELLASLSLAADLATGQPLGHGLSTSHLAVAVAQHLGCEPETVRSVQQVALIRFLGCTSDAHENSVITGADEQDLYAAMAPAAMGTPLEAIAVAARTVGAGKSLPRRIRRVAAALTDPPGRSLSAHCEVGAMLAGRLGLAESVVTALAHAYERWDGKGYPAGLAAEAIPIETRIGVVARDADYFSRSQADVAAVLRSRSGRAYDPAVAAVVMNLIPMDVDVTWEQVLADEPDPPAHIADVDTALTAAADFVDVKSPWTRGHSRRVADLAAGAAAAAGLPAPDAMRLRRAGLVHDLGRVGVGNGVWDRARPLGSGEWEQIRLHPYLTQRILERCDGLADLGEIASSHHERVDGSGYHRAAAGRQISTAARILAAADALAGLTAERPHRPALDLDGAAAVLHGEADAGRLDPDAVDWVLAAARGEPAIRPAPGSLSAREVEVLRLLARGETNRQIADTLFISPKTVGRHVENIYTKIGVSTRAGATVYAMEHRLLG